MTNIIPPLFQQQQPVVRRSELQAAAIAQGPLPRAAVPASVTISALVSEEMGLH